jgi:hypothetical protein
MTSTTSKYYVKHHVTSGDVARVHSRVHLPEEMINRFMKPKQTAKSQATVKKSAKKSTSSSKKSK